MPKIIALVEDEAAIRENYKAYLEQNGYQVTCYDSRPQALKGMERQMPDMAIIDIGLQDELEGGFDLCRELRQRSPQLPILILSARDSELDIVSGLRLGADDYLTKDIGLIHLGARILALFRRMDAAQHADRPNGRLQRGPLELDTDQFRATWHGQPLELTLTEFWIVHELVKRPGHVKSRDQLMEAANVVLDQATITSHIKRIRRKFKAINELDDPIQTMYGSGYRWHLQDGN